MNTNDKGMTSETLHELSSAAVARRRALLRGVGKGAAVLAATVPLQTLAGQSVLTFDGKHQCSVSGQHSGVHSATPDSTTRCSGFSPSYWGQRGADVTSPAKTWPVNSQVAFNSVFMQSGISVTLFQVMDNGGQYLTTDERHWLAAYLNAVSNNFNFPYTGAQVIDYYNLGSSSEVYQDALAFFIHFMETRNT